MSRRRDVAAFLGLVVCLGTARRWAGTWLGRTPTRREMLAYFAVLYLGRRP